MLLQLPGPTYLARRACIYTRALAIIDRAIIVCRTEIIMSCIQGSSLVILALFSLALVEGRDAERLVKRQTEQKCSTVTLNIDRIAAECEKSTTACLTESQNSIGTVSFIQGLICPPTKLARELFYDVLVGCTSQSNADIVYAGLCGNVTMDDGEMRPCTNAVLRLNDGSAAKTACCEGTETEFGSGSQCASELRRLTEDVGCCTAAAPLHYFFLSCKVDGNTGLDALLGATGVGRPELCNYTLYEPGGADRVSGSLATYPIIGLLVALAVCAGSFS